MNRTGNQLAFTAVELLAATALTAILMVAVMGVMGAISRGQKALDPPPQTTSADWLDLLHWDLANAVVLRCQNDQFVLRGYSSLDFSTMTPTHRPVEVVYQSLNFARHPWLVRRQRNLDDATNHDSRTELVHRGLRRLQVEVPVLDQDQSAPAAAPPPDQELSSPQPQPSPLPPRWAALQADQDWIAVPQRLRLLVWMTDGPPCTSPPMSDPLDIESPPTLQRVLAIR